jgi:hypothetical protein
LPRRHSLFAVLVLVAPISVDFWALGDCYGVLQLSFAFVNNGLKSKNNCIYFEKLFPFLHKSVKNAFLRPLESLQPPQALFVRGRFFKEYEWIEIWVFSAVTRILNPSVNWSPAIGHLILSFYHTNGSHLTNLSYNTVADVTISRQNPTGLAVANNDSLFVWFSGQDSSSVLARYTFIVCFDEEMKDCSPLLFEI